MRILLTSNTSCDPPKGGSTRANLAWLRLAFGLGCFLPWPLAMVCCRWISPRHAGVSNVYGSSPVRYCHSRCITSS